MPTIIETAVAAGNFNTLVSAVKAAGLAETLSGSGPFTVFAPTDEAFAKVHADTLQGLLKPEAKSQLVNVLTYHVVAGEVMASEIAELTNAKTVQGQSVAISVNGGVKVDGANVVTADIKCDNGVIHVIDAVILPN